MKELISEFSTKELFNGYEEEYKWGYWIRQEEKMF